MARAATRTIPQAVRELCLAFPEAEEFESHGSPNFRARKGRVFAVFALNHHGDGRVALWLNTPAMEQARLIASMPRHIFKPQYVGPSGWIGVELNRGVSWKRVIELTHMAYVHSSPAKLVARVAGAPRLAAPTVKTRRDRSPQGTEGAEGTRHDAQGSAWRCPKPEAPRSAHRSGVGKRPAPFAGTERSASS
jgi:hypothetical protein